jgi:hypothetical protein
MENESNKPTKTVNRGEAALQKNHGFSRHGPGTQNQDVLISIAEKDSKVNLPPKINSTKKS